MWHFTLHSLLRRRSINILSVKFVPQKLVDPYLRLGSVDILHIHSIPDEFRRLRRFNLKLGEVVVGAQRVRHPPLRLKLKVLRLGTLDILVKQAVKLTLNLNVQSPRLSSFDILVFVKQLPGNLPRYFNPGSRTRYITGLHIGTRQALSSDTILQLDSDEVLVLGEGVQVHEVAPTGHLPVPGVHVASWLALVRGRDRRLGGPDASALLVRFAHFLKIYLF